MIWTKFRSRQTKDPGGDYYLGSRQGTADIGEQLHSSFEWARWTAAVDSLENIAEQEKHDKPHTTSDFAK